MIKNRKFSRFVKILISAIVAIVIIYELIYLIQVGIESICNRSTGISVKILTDLADGKNPYGKEWLFEDNSLPVTYWESGFFHILPSLVLIKLLHISPITSTVVVHIVYVIAAMVIMYMVVKKLTNSVLVSLLASSVLFVCLNPTYVNGIRPDTLCTVLIMMITLLVTNTKMKNSLKEWILAVLCVLLLFLKIHYASVIVAVYIICFKNKRWIQLSVKNIFVGIIFCAITILIFPTFFSTFGIRIIQMFTSNNSNDDYAYMLYQWKELFIRYIPIFIVFIVGVVLSIKRIGSIFCNDAILFLTTNIVVNILGLCYMGKWSGNFLAYHNVMIMPMIIICSMLFLARIVNREDGVCVIITLLVVFSTIFLLAYYNDSYRIHNVNLYYSEHKYNEWIEDNKDKEMLLSPSCAQFAYDNDYYLWDWGDQIYLPYDIGTSPKWNALFPYTNQYRNKNIEYANMIMSKIQKKEYSLIVSDDYNEFGHKIGMKEDFWNAIKSNYELVEKDDLVGYWIPKGGN